MAPSICQTVVALLPVYASLTLAQDPGNNNVIGCSSVGCPNTTCTISNLTFTGIGVAPIISSNNSFPSFSWVKASGVENRTAINATFTDAFYLATPPSPDTQQILSDSEVPACAVFFRRVNATFPGSDTSLASATGTCASAMHQGCIDALTRRASQLDVGNSSSSEAVCARLQAEFEQNLDAECAQYAYGLDAWQDVSVLSIAGRVPITTEQNTSSNCWPILPKADDLTLIGEFGNFSNFDENTDSAMLYEMTPILSVFYPGGGNEGDSLVSSAEAQLTCLKVVQQSYGEPQTPPSKGSAPRSMLMSIEVLMGAACISLATLLL